jgi:1-acyl-sn-glycerol-3-phosphate acyltransferase
MSWRGYRFGTGCGRFIFTQTVQLKSIRLDAADRSGPFIIACTHLSHIDPFLLSIALRHRQIDWMARIEFWRFRVSGRLMEWMDAIPVRRFGVAANGIRMAIERLKRGRCVAICPEGGVAQGPRSVMRGGSMKKGVCLISYRTGAPVLPCIMLGTDKLNCVPPWIPFFNARLWIAFGPRLIYPQPDNPDRRAAREVMAVELSREYQALFQEAKETFGLSERDVP